MRVGKAVKLAEEPRLGHLKVREHALPFAGRQRRRRTDGRDQHGQDDSEPGEATSHGLHGTLQLARPAMAVKAGVTSHGLR